jgi:hypothetical protein
MDRTYSDQGRRWDTGMAPGGVNKVIGMDVTAQNGEHLGKVEDMTMSGQGRIQDVVIDLEPDNRMVSVPLNDLRFAQDHVIFLGDRADLAGMTAPGVYGYRSDTNYTGRNYTSRDTTNDKRYDMNRPDTKGHYGFWAPSYQRGYYDLGYWPNRTGDIPYSAPTYPPSK